MSLENNEETNVAGADFFGDSAHLEKCLKI